MACDADVMREQLEFLIEHKENVSPMCGCEVCGRYMAVRFDLLTPFSERNTIETAIIGFEKLRISA